ncbi:hypothetical protein JTE90_024280 [Oedothorax gibbosus]|uniref:Uncharacterized protein n=1 Tax=Oedothorax gibbosus TaxID=931172 RepID=A0AAV6VZW8_9ARAC|nr:hypothetical protein JTE90_024280 [Oedothorax gibbosus]
MSQFSKSKLYIKHNPEKVMPQYCVPLRDIQEGISSDSTPFAKLVLGKLTALERFFTDNEKCPLSVGMRNVLVGEFLGPIIEQGLELSKVPNAVDSIVESKKNKIEFEKVRNSLTVAQNKITELDLDLKREREANRKYLENGVSLSKSVAEIDKAYELRSNLLKDNYQDKYQALEEIEQKIQDDFNSICKKLEVGREKELSTAKEVLAHYSTSLNN